MSSAARRRAEQLAKLDGVTWELAAWTAETGPGGHMATHHSKLALLSVLIGERVADLRATVEAGAADVAWVEARLAGLDHYWDFFRAKFALHQSAVLRPYLRIADEYAWSCYAPADTDAAGEHHNEPPLTFISPAIAPYAVSRGAALPGDRTRGRLAGTVPIPLVGIPWAGLVHLPDVVILGHEVGHHIERDFRLTGTLGELLEPVPGHLPGRTGEIFADVYGALAGGGAFARAMADLLADGAEAQAGTATYPPAAFRLELIDATLAIAAQAPPPTPGPAAETAERLLTARYPGLRGRRLTEVLRFAERPAADAADALLEPMALSADLDMRQLMAAATLAFHRDPARYAGNGLAVRVLRHAADLAARAEGIRSAMAPADHTERDRHAAAAFAALLDEPLPL